MTPEQAAAPGADEPSPFGGARRAARDMGLQLIGRVANLLLGSVVIVTLTRELGAQGFGQWSAIFAVCQIVGYLGQLGLEPAAVRRIAERPEREAELLGALLVLRLVLAVPATVACFVVVALLAETSQMVTAGGLASLITLISAPAALGIVFQLRVRNDVPVAVTFVNSVVWTAAVAVLAATGHATLVTFAAAMLGAQALASAIQVTLALRTTPVRFHGLRARIPDLTKVGFVLAISQLLNFAYVRIDQVLVLHFTDARQAGLYGASYQLLDRAQFLPLTVMTTLLPMLVAAHTTDRVRLHRLITRGFELLALASLPILAFSIVAGEPFIVLLFGEDFREAAPALPVLMGAFLLTSFGYLLGNLALVVGTQGRLAVNAGIALVLNVGLNVVLLPRYGFEAAAWVTLGTEVLTLALAYPITIGRLGAKLPLGRLPRLILAAAVLALALWGLRSAGLGIWWLLAATLPVYAAAVLALRAVDLAELRRLVPGSR